MECKFCSGRFYFGGLSDTCWRCEERQERQQKALDAFKRKYQHADMFLGRKILAGKRAKLSLRKIAEALEIPVRDVEMEWNTILQDGR